MKLTPPKYSNFDKHLWADFFELVCLSNIDRYMSKADMEDRIILDMRDGNITFDDDDDSDEYLIPQNISPDFKRKVKEKLELFSGDLLSFFKYRSSAYGKSYPFIVKDNCIKLRKSLTTENNLYIYLLMSSHLLYFDKKETGWLTSDFETFSYYCLTNYFGPNAKISIFGKNTSKNKTLFKGNKYTKFKKLSGYLNEQMNHGKEMFNPKDNGDDGIDLVGWIDFNDKAPGKVIITGQCKCQQDWHQCRFSSSYEALNGIIKLTHPNVNFSFIPICYRRDNGVWHQPKYSGVIVVDRQRIVSLMKKNIGDFQKSNSYKVVTNFAKIQEEIV